MVGLPDGEIVQVERRLEKPGAWQDSGSQFLQKPDNSLVDLSGFLLIGPVAGAGKKNPSPEMRNILLKHLHRLKVHLERMIHLAG